MHFKQDPSDLIFFQNPYPSYDKMRSFGPCFYWEEYGHICFTGHKQVNALLRDRRLGRQIDLAANLTRDQRCPYLAKFDRNSLLEMEPPNHTRLRRLINRAFVSRQVETQRSRISTLANSLIDKYDTKGKEFDLIKCYAEVIPVIVICEVLGIPTSMADQLVDWSHKMVAIYEHGSNQEIEAIANDATMNFELFIKMQISIKKAKPEDDLLTKLIRVKEEDDCLSEDELVATCILLLNAGHEATVHGIGNSVKTIIENKIDIAHWIASPENLKALSEECLRFDPPLHMFTRFVLEDFEYEEQKFKRGEVLGLLLAAANRDALKFDKPHLFSPFRGGIGHLSFGAGIHFCVGAPLARIEVETALKVLFERIPTIEISQTPIYADRYHFHGLEKLNVIRK
ncbi:MAG: cytochrome P450 [Candidatus Azotimanducaceae bacterium]|jgi:cytochrome P450